MLPVHRRGHAVVGCQLQRIDDPQDLFEISTRARGIGQRKFHLFIGPDYEDRAYGKSVVGLWMDHSIEIGDFTIRVRDQRKVESMTLGFGYVACPGSVVFEWINAETDHFNAAFVEFRFQAGNLTKFRCANRSEIRRVREQHRPVVTHPFMEFERAIGCVGLEIGCGVAKLKCH